MSGGLVCTTCCQVTRPGGGCGCPRPKAPQATDEQGRSSKANACCYRHFCKAESAAYLLIAEEVQKLRAENARLHHERAEDVDRMEKAAECIERLNAECNQLAGLHADVGDKPCG